MTDYTRCGCAECQRLDALPLKRQGIPHAWQPSMLSASHDPRPIEPMHAPWESLPLFGTLEPDLFA